MKRCPYCGSQVDDTASSCPKCSSDLRHAEPLTKEEFGKEDKEEAKKLQEEIEQEPEKQPIDFRQLDPVTVYKIVGFVLLIVIGLYFWYALIPILMIWYIWKKTKQNNVTKAELTGVILVIVFIGVFHFIINRAPTVTITEPEEDALILDESVHIEGTVSPADSFVSINNLDIPVIDGRFSYDYPLVEGENYLDFYAINDHFFFSFGVHGTSSAQVVVTRVLSEEELQEKAQREQEKEEAEQARIEQEQEAAEQAEKEAKKAAKKAAEEEEEVDPVYQSGIDYFDGLLTIGQISEYEIDSRLNTVWVYVTQNQWDNIADKQGYVSELFAKNQESFGLKAVSVHNVDDFNLQYAYGTGSRVTVY